MVVFRQVFGHTMIQMKSLQADIDKRSLAFTNLRASVLKRVERCPVQAFAQ